MSLTTTNYTSLADFLPTEDWLADLGFNHVLTSYKNNAPDRLRRNNRAANRKARGWLRDEGLLTKLQAINPSGTLRHFVIDCQRDLGLPYGLPALFDKGQAKAIKNAFHKVMQGRPYFAKLEVGQEERIHIHVLAFECPLKPTGGQCVRSLPKLAAYLAKPPMTLPNNAEQYIREECIKLGTYLWLKQMQEGRCPRTTFYGNIPQG